MSVKRYDLQDTGQGYYPHRQMVEEPEGDWVRWEDVKDLLGPAPTSFPALRAAVDDMDERLRAAKAREKPTDLMCSDCGLDKPEENRGRPCTRCGCRHAKRKSFYGLDKDPI